MAMFRALFACILLASFTPGDAVAAEGADPVFAADIERSRAGAELGRAWRAHDDLGCESLWVDPHRDERRRTDAGAAHHARAERCECICVREGLSGREDAALPIPAQIVRLHECIDRCPCDVRSAARNAMDFARAPLSDEIGASVRRHEEAVRAGKGRAFDRAPTIARKVALCYGWDYGPAVHGKPWRMGIDILEPAIEFTELHVKSLVDLSDVIAEHPDARLRRSVLQAIEERGGLATLGQILGIMKMRKRPIIEMLDSLMEEGRVRRIKTTNGYAYEKVY